MPQNAADKDNHSPRSHGGPVRTVPVKSSSIYICRRLSETNILGKCLRSGLGRPRFVISDYRRPSPDGGISQPVGFNVVFTRNMGYGEVERAGQFSAGSCELIETPTTRRTCPSAPV